MLDTKLPDYIWLFVHASAAEDAYAELLDIPLPPGVAPSYPLGAR